jgi:TolA-binding protein
MKRRIIRLGLSLLVIILASCTETKSEKVNEAAEDVRDAQEELDQAQREYAEEVENYRQSMQTDIDNNKQEIARLRERRINDRAEVIRRRNERIDELQRRNEEMEARIRDYKSNNRENWQEFKREFNNDMDELGKAFRDLGKDNVK